MRRSGAAERTDDPPDAGFAAADALVALTLCAMLLALVLNAASTGLRASRLGWERSLATTEAEYRLAMSWPASRTPGEQGGPSADGGTWRLKAQVIDAEADSPGLCEVDVEVRSGQPARSTRLQTVRFCRGVR